MKKSILIIPYFGRFNNYFQLFLNSCKDKKHFDFLIFTDDKTEYSYPSNVMVHYVSFEDVISYIQKKFDFKIGLKKAYKLCDFRPFYGYIFSDYIEEYSYWGYCDTDLIFGDLDRLVQPIVEQDFDKIFFLGHFSLIKNTKELLELPLKKHYTRCMHVLSSPNNHSFDEEFNYSINSIYLESNKNLFREELEANIYTKSSELLLTKFNFEDKKYEVYRKNRLLFIFDKGKILGYFRRGTELVNNEYIYIHLQSRIMKVKIDQSSEFYKIIPNAFENIEFDYIDFDNFNKIKRKNINLHYFRLRAKNLFIKMARLIKNEKY